MQIYVFIYNTIMNNIFLINTEQEIISSIILLFFFMKMFFIKNQKQCSLICMSYLRIHTCVYSVPLKSGYLLNINHTSREIVLLVRWLSSYKLFLYIYFPFRAYVNKFMQFRLTAVPFQVKRKVIVSIILDYLCLFPFSINNFIFSCNIRKICRYKHRNY